MIIADLLNNRTIESFKIGEHGQCCLRLSSGYSLIQESLLRYIGASGEFITAKDHQQQFGLPSLYDAEQDIRGKIVGKIIKRVELNPETGDLALILDDGRIEIICTSAGYEAYQHCGPDNFILVGHGGSEKRMNQVVQPTSLTLDH